MNHNPKAYFLFSPTNGHYTNAMTLYSSYKRALTKNYYGTPKVQSKIGQEEEAQQSFKGTLFSQCETPYEVFNTQRRVKLMMK